ncbi:M16 family metallopeptidase [Moraxella atlantae]|uniref:M16 family metallopeptidase n=1 Tax=Faucicola atlantae TaxID=34059 RepID=UPI003751A46E
MTMPVRLLMSHFAVPYFNRYAKKSHVVLLGLLLTGVSNAYAADAPMGERRNADIDPNAPIAALDTLASLKNVPPLQFTLPKIQHFTTTTGTPVAFVATPNLPMVDVSVYFNAGSARDTAIKPQGFGLATLTADALTKGNARYDEEAFNQAVEQLGLELDAAAYKDMLIVNLRSLSDSAYLSPALTLLADTLRAPSFSENSLNRSKAQMMVALARQQEDPDAIAAQTFNRALYGNHPYAHPTLGTVDSVPKLSRKDVQAFARRFLVAQNANIAITGDLTLAQARALANQLTGAMPQGKPAPALPNAKPLTTSRHIHVPFDSTQTAVIIGQLGEKRRTDPVALQAQTDFALANDIVGGGNFQARLMADIRKKRGLTYGIYSNMTPMQSQGSYTVTFSTRNDKTAEAVAASQAVLQDVVQNGVSQAELDLTKDAFINRFAQNFASNAATNATIGMMGFYGLKDDYLTNYVTRVQRANRDTVSQRYRMLIDPQRLLIVTVGQGDVGSDTSGYGSQTAQPAKP